MAGIGRAMKNSFDEAAEGLRKFGDDLCINQKRQADKIRDDTNTARDWDSSQDVPQSTSGGSGSGTDAPNSNLPDPTLPPGVKPGWQPRPANNGNGMVYQRPGATGNADSIRITGPADGYPHGYVRFYNNQGGGQPLNLLGKPGTNADTHIPRLPDGSYPLPEDW